MINHLKRFSFREWGFHILMYLGAKVCPSGITMLMFRDIPAIGDTFIWKNKASGKAVAALVVPFIDPLSGCPSCHQNPCRKQQIGCFTNGK